MQIRNRVKTLYSYFGSRLWQIVLNSLLGCIDVFSILGFVWCTKKLIDIATNGNNEELFNYIIILVVLITVRLICASLRRWLENRNSAIIINNLKSKLFDKVLKSRYLGKEKFHSADVINRFEVDIKNISNTLSTSVPQIIVTLIQFFASFIFLQYIEPTLAWVLVAIMPIALLLSKRYFMVIRRLNHDIRNKESKIQEYIQERIQQRSLFNSIDGEERSSTLLSSLQNELLGGVMRQTRYTIFSNTAIRVGFMAGYITAFVWAVYGLSAGTVTFGVMSALLQLVAQIQTPLVELSSQVSKVAQSISSFDRVEELMQLEQEGRGDNEIFDNSIGIRVDNISFSFDDQPDKLIFKGFSYDFIPNRLHAVMGESGSGKSTLIRLILAFLNPTKGNIVMYDKNGKECECSPMTRHNIIYVPQGNSLISGSVRDNLLLADSLADDSKIKEALHIAAADFVYNLPNGIDTICGERGAGLSEGEAQRVAIARGILKSGNLLLLDEPTAALDSDTEKKLITRLKSFAKNKSVIIITHNIETANLCESITKLIKS